ncbi:MAG: DMT family transporter [Propionibacteriales bacterium]|nr:DMT family transporter [Propionibacteriales bacterium]
MAIVLSLLSSLMWGASDFSGGLISRRRSTLVIVGWSATFGFILASLAVALSGGMHGPYGWIAWGVAAGAAGALGLICYYYALATGTMGVVAPVTSLGVIVPVMVGVLSGESPSRLTLAGIVVAIVGVVLTSGPEFSGGASPRPVIVATLAGFFFGVFFVFMANGSDDSALLTLWTMRATVTTAFVLAALMRRTTGGLGPTDYVWVLCISAGDLGANLTFGIASTKGYVSITSVLSSLFPVVTVLLARVVLHERLRRVQVVGVAVTMLGVAFISAG